MKKKIGFNQKVKQMQRSLRMFNFFASISKIPVTNLSFIVSNDTSIKTFSMSTLFKNPTNHLPKLTLSCNLGANNLFIVNLCDNTDSSIELQSICKMKRNIKFIIPEIKVMSVPVLLCLMNLWTVFKCYIEKNLYQISNMYN